MQNVGLIINLTKFCDKKYKLNVLKIEMNFILFDQEQNLS